MGKKRVPPRGARQVRQVRPKGAPVPAAPADQRKQRERYVRTGGMMQGYAPELVMRIAHIAAAGAGLCALVMVLLIVFLPYGLPVRIVAAIAWVIPIGLGVTFILPGYQLARKDRGAEPKLVQGQLLGIADVSTSLGLGMLRLKTRGGAEEYLVAPDKMAKVPGNQVNVMLTVTPNLRHVRGVGVMGQRMMGRPDQPVPEVLRRLRLMPIVTPAALAAGAIIGDDVVAILPIRPDLVHALASLLAGGALLGAVYGASYLFQRRIQSEVQALVPGGMR
jgi:hypothetical protein